MTPARGHSVKRSPLSGGANRRRSHSGRFGATLVEVLMSILIMAVGIVSVFTLFPIAVLRTIKATQDTNSKILKLNVSELVATSPVRLLTAFEPGTQRFVAGATTPLVFRDEWQPNTNYPGNPGAAQVIVPTLKPGDLIPRPLAFFWTTDTFTSGSTEPVWGSTTSGQIAESGGTWNRLPVPYVIDPWGWNIANDDGLNADVRRSFGNKTDTTTGVATAFPFNSSTDVPLMRIHGSLNSTPTALDSVCMLDNWEEVFSGVPLSATFTTVTLPAGVDLGGLSATSSRLVITSTDGSKTIYRRIDSINSAGGVITLNSGEPISSLPTSFPQDAGGNPDIGLVRAEVLNRRFSWFLTVRNSSTQPEIKCAVVFNRNLATASEHAYDANFSIDTLDIDNDSVVDITQHGLAANRTDWVKIIWNPTNAGPGTLNEPEPLIKPGNYIFDARHVAWYRVQQIHERGSAGGFEHAVLILDKPVRDLQSALTGRAILMPGVVEVFDL